MKNITDRIKLGAADFANRSAVIDKHFLSRCTIALKVISKDLAYGTPQVSINIFPIL